MDHVLLDRDTLRVVLAVVELTVAPIVAMIWMRNRDVRGVHWWIGTSVFTTIGFSAPILFSLTASDARFVNDFFGIMALALMLQGTLVHRGKEALAKAGLFVLPLFAIVLAAMMVSVYGQDASRYIVFDPLVILITLAIGLHLAHWSRPVRFSARNLSAFYLLALSAAFFVRWSVVLASDNKAEVLANPFHGYLYLVLISVTIAWNCCIILMCNESAHTKATDIANTDPLTRLPNRRSFEVNLHQSIESARRETNRFALALIDLDEFKQINDRHGHPTGDQMLVEFAQRLKRHARTTDFVARLGGDEFVMIIRDAENPQKLSSIIERLKPYLNGTVLLNDVPVEIRVSIGGATWPHDGEHPREILRHADMRMYEDKRIHKMRG